MKIYLHTEDKPEPDAVDVELDTKLETLVASDDGELVLLAEDQDEPLDLTSTFEQAGITVPSHLTLARRLRLAVSVLYNGEHVEHEFSASTRVLHVLEWALRKFEITGEEAAEHTLAILPSNEIPDPDRHIGSLEQARPGHVEFALVPKHRYEG
jgi:hypothetical protein